MPQKNFAGQRLPQGKIDHAHLKGLYRKNVGSNTVTLIPDLNMLVFLTSAKRKMISKIVLKPSETAWVDNQFFIVTSDDGKPIRLAIARTEAELKKLNADFESGKIQSEQATAEKFLKDHSN